MLTQKRSKYSKHLKEYFELFGRENILLIKSEEMGKSPHENIAKVCEFLNVEPDDDLPLLRITQVHRYWI